MIGLAHCHEGGSTLSCEGNPQIPFEQRLDVVVTDVQGNQVCGAREVVSLADDGGAYTLAAARADAGASCNLWGPLFPGEYTLTVSAPGYESRSQTFVVPSCSGVTVDVQLVRLGDGGASD